MLRDCVVLAIEGTHASGKDTLTHALDAVLSRARHPRCHRRRTGPAQPVHRVTVVATLMFVRMRTEVVYALGSPAGVTVLVIALVLAVVSVLANFLVVAIHALDGSDQVARLNSLSAATNRPLSRAHRMREKAALIPHRITVRDRRAHRAAVQAITRAGRYLVTADQVIDTAHAVHQGTGLYSTPAADPNDHDRVAGYRDGQSAPRPDLRPLDTALEHISTPGKAGTTAPGSVRGERLLSGP